MMMDDDEDSMDLVRELDVHCSVDTAAIVGFKASFEM